MPKGFNRFGNPITCGAITEWGTECPQPVEPGLSACVKHDPIMWRRRLDKMVAQGHMDQEEADRDWEKVHGNREGR